MKFLYNYSAANWVVAHFQKHDCTRLPNALKAAAYFKHGSGRIDVNTSTFGSKALQEFPLNEPPCTALRSTEHDFNLAILSPLQ